MNRPRMMRKQPVLHSCWHLVLGLLYTPDNYAVQYAFLHRGFAGSIGMRYNSVLRRLYYFICRQHSSRRHLVARGTHQQRGKQLGCSSFGIQNQFSCLVRRNPNHSLEIAPYTFCLLFFSKLWHACPPNIFSLSPASNPFEYNSFTRCETGL